MGGGRPSAVLAIFLASLLEAVDVCMTECLVTGLVHGHAEEPGLQEGQVTALAGGEIGFVLGEFLSWLSARRAPRVLRGAAGMSHRSPQYPGLDSCFDNVPVRLREIPVT